MIWGMSEEVALRPAREDDLPLLEDLTQDPEKPGEFEWFGLVVPCVPTRHHLNGRQRSVLRAASRHDGRADREPGKARPRGQDGHPHTGCRHPILSMRSARELCGTADPGYLAAACAAFFAPPGNRSPHRDRRLY